MLVWLGANMGIRIRASSILFSLWHSKNFCLPITQVQEDFMTEKDENTAFRIRYLGKRN